MIWFVLKILVTALTVIVGVGYMLKKSFKADRRFKDSISEAIKDRRSLDANWDTFFTYFLNKGFNKTEVQVVIGAIQQYSQVAQIMMLPHDDLYADLKVDATDEDDDKIMMEIAEKLDLEPYNEGELIDNDISNVNDLFDFINSKRQQTVNKNLFLR